MTPEEFLNKKGYYAGSLMLSKTTGQGLVSIAQAMQEYVDQQLFLQGVSNWLACKNELPKHGETVLTYTPLTEMASEQVRLMKYGTLKSGFPAGITHWQRIDKPTCY